MKMAEENRNNWIFGRIKSPLDNKDEMFKHVVLQMLTKSLRMFKYNNLPDTISQKDLEIQLQVAGYAIIKDVGGKLYSFTGGLGGKPNPYYLPTQAIVANPALNYNESLTIDENCVVILNDDFYQGMMPLHNKYGAMLTEAELSLKYAIINARVPALIEADNDGTYESAIKFFEKIVEGSEYGVISSKDFFDGIRSHDFYKEAYIKDIIESIQYIKGSWYNEMGVNAAFNMKREAINEAEAALNEDILYPTVDSMFKCRNIGWEKANKMFGCGVTVEFDSIWAQNRKIEDLSIEAMESEINEVNNES